METQKAELRRKAFDLAKRRFDLAKELKVSIYSSLQMTIPLIPLQNAAHAAIDETQNVTRTSLRHMQHSANVAAIEKLLETRDTRMRAAMQEFNQGVNQVVFFMALHGRWLIVVSFRSG